MEYINNGDSASSIRTKLNELIDFYNASSATTTTTTMYMGDTTTTSTTMYMPPMGDTTTTSTTMYFGDTTTTTTMYMGGTDGSAVVWDLAPAMPIGLMDIPSACSAINTGTSHTIYIKKGAGNMAGTDVPEMNDYLYSDISGFNTLAPASYFGYYDSAMAMNKYIAVGPAGVVTQVNYCA
jgi:hypothetical protein